MNDVDLASNSVDVDTACAFAGNVGPRSRGSTALPPCRPYHLVQVLVRSRPCVVEMSSSTGHVAARRRHSDILGVQYREW